MAAGMDDSDPARAEALIRAVNEALAGAGGQPVTLIQTVAAMYRDCLAAGLPEQRAFEVALFMLRYFLDSNPVMPGDAA